MRVNLDIPVLSPLTLLNYTIAYSIATDILCSLLPIYVVWGVQIKMHVKVAVCGLMSLGLL